MRLNQTYIHTPKIQELIISLEANKKALSLIDIPEDQKLNLRRHSLLNSALFSARIENNPLTLETFHSSPKNLKKLEVQNILDTLNWIYQQKTVLKLDLKTLRELHGKVMQRLHSEAGHFRTEQSAVFNEAGIAIYLAPPALEVKPLISSWLTDLNSPKLPLPVQIAFAHYQFEKIHPFLDGNGRTGRLVTTILLKNHGYDLQGIASLEKYLENNRDDYYAYLAIEKREITSFVEYFLTAIVAMQESALAQLKTGRTERLSLFPRQKEIVDIIRDHPYCSFDFLHRRFFAVPKSTLHYDLQKLQKLGLVERTGRSRGAIYSVPPTE